MNNLINLNDPKNSIKSPQSNLTKEITVDTEIAKVVLIQSIFWNPNNIVYGPRLSLRKNDPRSNIDTELIDGTLIL